MMENSAISPFEEEFTVVFLALLSSYKMNGTKRNLLIRRPIGSYLDKQRNRLIYRGDSYTGTKRNRLIPRPIAISARKGIT